MKWAGAVLAMLALTGTPAGAQPADEAHRDIARAHAHREPAAPLAWQSLSPEQQRMLARYESRWGELPPRRQRALAAHSQRWLRLSPEEREALRARMREFQSMPREERVRLRRQFRHFQSLPAGQRTALREQWEAATPDERRRMLERLRSRADGRSRPGEQAAPAPASGPTP